VEDAEEEKEKVEKRKEVVVDVPLVLLVVAVRNEEELAKRKNAEVVKDVAKFSFFSAFLLFHKIIKNYHLNHGR
jgi:hypothetical protein